ncbi:MAG: hypothetical protein U0325_33940 [Polyangiales bacterium]
MRIALVTAAPDHPIAEALRDLGCAAREHPPLTPPAEVVRGTDALVVDGADDLDLARFILERCRALDPGSPRSWSSRPRSSGASTRRGPSTTSSSAGARPMSCTSASA